MLCDVCNEDKQFINDAWDTNTDTPMQICDDCMLALYEDEINEALWNEGDFNIMEALHG